MTIKQIKMEDFRMSMNTLAEIYKAEAKKIFHKEWEDFVKMMNEHPIASRLHVEYDAMSMDVFGTTSLSGNPVIFSSDDARNSNTACEMGNFIDIREQRVYELMNEMVKGYIASLLPADAIKQPDLFAQAVKETFEPEPSSLEDTPAPPTLVKKVLQKPYTVLDFIAFFNRTESETVISKRVMNVLEKVGMDTPLKNVSQAFESVATSTSEQFYPLLKEFTDYYWLRENYDKR